VYFGVRLAVMDQMVCMSLPWFYDARCGSITGDEHGEVSCKEALVRDERVVAMLF
jgi:hypothetical protein